MNQYSITLFIHIILVGRGMQGIIRNLHHFFPLYTRIIWSTAKPPQKAKKICRNITIALSLQVRCAKNFPCSPFHIFYNIFLNLCFLSFSKPVVWRWASSHLKYIQFYLIENVSFEQGSLYYREN